MRSKLLIGGLGAAVAFLLATSPVVAQAAGFITSGDIVNSTIKSKDVKNNNLKGKDVKDNNLTGKDINEGSLAKVPSASTADSATTAGSAGGVSPSEVVYRSASTTPVTIFNGGGLSIDASCTNTGDTIVLVARTSAEASIYSYLVDLEEDTANEVLGNDSEGEGFAVGDEYDLTSGATNAQVDPSLVTFQYDTRGGTVITGTLALDTFNQSGDVCAVTGQVFVS